MGDMPTLSDLRRAVAPLAEARGLKRVLVFGSYGRGEAEPDSDIDIVVEGGEGFRPLSVYAFGEDVRAATGRRVDVFETSEIDEGPFRDRVLAEAVALWDAGEVSG